MDDNIYKFICIYIDVCVCLEKGKKTEERYMFDGYFYVLTRFDFKVLSEFKNILSKLFFYEK